MSEKDPDKIKYLVNNTQYPVLLKNVCNWPLLSWTLNDWSTNIGHLSVPFR